MSGYVPFLVASQKTGVDLSLDPWLIPQDAYQQILDAYQYLGVITKRDGYSWFDAVPHAIDPLIYYNITNITNGPASVVTTVNPHGLLSGQIVRLTDVNGLTGGDAPINGTRWTITVLTPTTFSINNAVGFGGAYVPVPTAGVVSIFPSSNPATYLPIMCIANWVGPQNNSNIMVLDTRRASIYDASQRCLKPIGHNDQFTGSDKNLFWWENYSGVTPAGVVQQSIYFTNNVDNIFYWNDGPNLLSTQLQEGLISYRPDVTIGNGTGVLVDTCLMIKAINGRLVLFNTQENGTRFPTRVRWSGQNILLNTNGATNPDFGNNGWLSLATTPGIGGTFDVTDSQYLITQGQIQNNIVLVSQNNTIGQAYSVFYEMRPVDDPQTPFFFNKLAQSRNIISTFGTIVIDRELTLVGDNGLIVTDGNTVTRYDNKIPNFAIQNMDQQSFDRCFGIRYDPLWQTWLLYTENGFGKNNKVLVYNYMDKSWCEYRIPRTDTVAPDLDDGLSCLGTTQYKLSDPVWIDYNGSVEPDWAWADFGNQTFNSLVQNSSLVLLGGDYKGNVWLMNDGGGDAADNVPHLQPIDNGKAIEMNIISRQWFPYAKQARSSQFGYIDLLIDSNPQTVVAISFNVDNEDSAYATKAFSCIPFENIILATISNITQAVNAQVTANDHGLEVGQVIYIYSVQGMIEINDDFYTVVTVIDEDNFTINVNSTTFTPYLSDGIITSQEITQTTFWTRIWSGQTGVFHTIQLVSSGVDEEFTLHAAMPYFKISGDRIYKGN